MKGSNWLEVIRFLKHLDKYGYQKHFLLPLLNLAAKRTPSTNWMREMSGLEDGEVVELEQFNRFKTLFDGYIDIKGAPRRTPYEFSEEFKLTRNKVQQSVAEFERITELANF
jgi:hypothetical protein